MSLPFTNGAAGPRVQLFRSTVYDPTRYDVTDLFKVGSILADILMVEDDNFIIAGSIGILDLGNTLREQLCQVEPMADLMKKMQRLNVEAQPYNVSSFHYINVPDAFDAVFSIIKGFMSEEYRCKVCEQLFPRFFYNFPFCSFTSTVKSKRYTILCRNDCCPKSMAAMPDQCWKLPRICTGKF